MKHRRLSSGSSSSASHANGETFLILVSLFLRYQLQNRIPVVSLEPQMRFYRVAEI